MIKVIVNLFILHICVFLARSGEALSYNLHLKSATHSELCIPAAAPPPPALLPPKESSPRSHFCGFIPEVPLYSESQFRMIRKSDQKIFSWPES